VCSLISLAQMLKLQCSLVQLPAGGKGVGLRHAGKISIATRTENLMIAISQNRHTFKASSSTMTETAWWRSLLRFRLTSSIICIRKITKLHFCATLWEYQGQHRCFIWKF